MMTAHEIVIYACLVICFMLASAGIMRGKKVAAIVGVILMAIFSGALFYIGGA